ncbi:hypothetical protein [Gordonia terrae]
MGLGGANSGLLSAHGLMEFFTSIPPLEGVLHLGCPACRDVMNPATYRAFRNHPGVLYSNVATEYDEIVNPVRVAFLPPAPNVTNVMVQDVCPASRVGHAGLAYDSTVTQILVNQLDPQRASPVVCNGRGLPV